MLAPNTLLQNRYLIVRSIGRGGMGAVYLARDERLAHTVALKETFFTDERLRKAFEREARLLAHLRHPALPKVTDHFDEDGGQFIVMEFISGEDLEMLLAQRGTPFPVEQVMHWGDELLKALDYLHKQDPPILHRDIKPANLKLTSQNEIILLDFGLAKGTAGQSSSVMTSKSIFGFTPNFAPLEQIQGTGTGPRSDLYSLAATLYYLMTGAIPPDALTRITEIANGQPDPLRRADEIVAQIPSGVADLLMKAMAHNRDHRPASAAEMRRMLREVSPPIPSVVAFAGEQSSEADERGQKDTLLPSTLVESTPTQETPPAAATAAATLPVTPTVEPTPAGPETAPASAMIAETKIGRKGLRLPWAIAGFVVLLMIGVTIGLVSNSSLDKASQEPGSNVALKESGPTGAPMESVSLQPVAAPDDSEIISTTDSTGAQIKTRTFRSNTRIRSVVVTLRAGKQSASVFSNQGAERILPDDRVATALVAAGDTLADAVGFVETPPSVGSESKGQPRSPKGTVAKADVKPASNSRPPNIASPQVNTAFPSQRKGNLTEQNKIQVPQNIDPGTKGAPQPRAQDPLRTKP